MERNTLPSNNLGSSKNLGLTTSQTREQSPAQGQTGSEMRVEQVKSKAGKQALQSLIDKAGNLSNPRQLHTFISQHLPDGKHFNLIAEGFRNGFGDFTTLITNTTPRIYTNNPNPTDNAYLSIIKNTNKNNINEVRRIAFYIKDQDKKDKALLHILKICDPSDSSTVASCLRCIQGTKQKQLCYEMLPEALKHWDSFRSITEILQDELGEGLNFESSLIEHIKDKIGKIYINMDLCLSRVSNPENIKTLKDLAAEYQQEQERLKPLAEEHQMIAKLKWPGYQQISLEETLDGISKLKFISKEEKDDLYLHVFKNSDISINDKIKSIQDHVLDTVKKDQAYADLAKLQKQPLKIELCLNAIEDPDLKQKVLGDIIQSPFTDLNCRTKLLPMITDKDLAHKQLMAFAKDNSLPWDQRFDAAMRLSSQDKDPIILSFLSDPRLDVKSMGKTLGSLVDAISDIELRDQVCISLIQERDLRDHYRLDIIAKISDKSLETRERLLVGFIKHRINLCNNPHLVTDDMLDADFQFSNKVLYKAFSYLKEPDTIKTVAQELLQEPIIHTEQDLYRAFWEQNLGDLIRITMNMPIEGLQENDLERVKNMKLAAATFMFNLDNDNIDALTTLLVLQDERENSPYSLYKTIVRKSKEIVSLEDHLEKKQRDLASVLANGKKVCLSANAFSIPTVMDAKWKKSFKEVNFPYFTRIIQCVFQDLRAQIEGRLSKPDDIAQIDKLKKSIEENSTLEKEYLKFFESNGRSVLQNALNTPSQISSHGNKMKAIALHIENLRQEGKAEDALTKLAELRENMQTCSGGDQQAIETAYMNMCLSEVKDGQKVLSVGEAVLEKERQKILNILYKIRLNWVLENTHEFRNGKEYVQYSPKAVRVSFPIRLSELSKHGHHLSAPGAFGNTHTGLAILGMAGPELALREEGSHSSFDVNGGAAARFIMDAGITKASIIEAFTDVFTFANICEAIGQELWSSLATASQLPLKTEELFSDEDCTQQADLSDLNSQDPMSSGLKAFLGSIEEAKKALANAAQGSDGEHEYTQLNLKQDILNLMEQKVCYYEDTFGDAYDITLYTGFSKEALARILEELGLLKVLP